MSTIHILGIDLGKHCFHAVGNNHTGKDFILRKFSRSRAELIQRNRCRSASQLTQADTS
ncbi:hypothetical protein [Vibrio campbellii]|uniref:hypothetical protein n=1 Tax=Vibrio campbellii TaxID=680 RepID=UPI0002F7EC72|nr:hypothetical protein [Vibrio campbellii]